MSVPATQQRSLGRALLHAVEEPVAPNRLWLLALAGVVGVGVLYHWFQSRGHVTPAVFTDELLFSELARGFASGDWFAVRDHHVFFPAFVPALLQAPAWLAGSTPLAYALAKGLNTLLMCSAALPAYWLARQLVRPGYALIVAAATVAGGGMLYHGYLTSEAAAYPVFLFAIAVIVRAVTVPSPRRDLVALAVLGLAVLTRAQFVVLPLVFALSILLVGRPIRRHATALVGLGAGAVIVAIAGASALGFYEGARTLDYPLGETLRWSGWTAALLPFAAGVLVVPGALLGLGLSVARPRTVAERAFAVPAILLVVLMPLQAGLIAGGESHKPFERYAFYLLPLLYVAFFTFAERGVRGRALHAVIALAVAGLALAVPFPSLALDAFSFDSPTLSAVETLGRWTSQGEAAAVFGAVGVLAALVAAVLHRRPVLVAVVSVALAFLVGAAAYAGDRRMTRRTLDSLAPAQLDWLERSGVDEADVLTLPGGSLHAGWVLESWNRNVGRMLHLGDLPTDPLPFTQVGIGPDGTVSPSGQQPLRTEYLVVEHSGSQIELEGELVARPKAGLALYRPDNPVRLRSIAVGLYPDGWAQSVFGYTVFPGRVSGGTFRVSLSLPAGRPARRVELEAGPVKRRLELRPGTTVTTRLPVSGPRVPPLSIRVDRADFVDANRPHPRLVAARVGAIDFVPDAPFSTGSRK